jgi:hypothetical protein
MMMIERISGIEFLMDHKITDLKHQFPTRPILIRDMPSSSAAPPSTRSSTTAPPLAHASSSSSGIVLRVLKSMFAWCCDTRQCQDVLLSNQRRQNEKLGIDEFPLLVPPLDDDPFASLSLSLSAVDLVAMESSPDGDEETSGSEYEEDDDE